MKIQTRPQTQGSVLLVSLLTASVIGVALGSYLTLTANQHQSVYRSMTWNEGIPVAEAGVEEALTHIYYYGVTNFAANNWTWGTDGRYHKQRFVGATGAYYDVCIQPVDPPVIFSTAYVLPARNDSRDRQFRADFQFLRQAAHSGENHFQQRARRRSDFQGTNQPERQQCHA